MLTSDVRARADYVTRLSDELAAHCAGAFIVTRIRDAVADLASHARVPTLKHIPHVTRAMPTMHAKAGAATALRAFATAPCAGTWLALDRAMSQLEASYAGAVDKLPSRALNPLAHAPEPTIAPCKRAPLEAVRSLHAGSGSIAKISPSDCPPSFSSNADASERRALNARRLLGRWCKTRNIEPETVRTLLASFASS